MTCTERERDGFAGKRSRILNARLERVGQVVLLIARDVGLKMVVGTKIYTGIEAAIGPRSIVLAVAPPHKKLVG